MTARNREPSTPRRGRRRTFGPSSWVTGLGLTCVWILLWGEISVLVVVSGIAVAFVVLAAFPLPPISFTGRVRPIGLLKLVAVFFRDLVVASVQVGWLAVRFERPPPNAVIGVPLRSRSDLYLMITAELVSLVPGSLLVEAVPNAHTLYLHILGTATAHDIERARASALAQEARVLGALASDEELKQYRERSEGGTP